MRTLAFALVLSLAVPAGAAAQTAGDWSDRFSITAFTGARAPFTTGNVVVYGEDGGALFAAREQRGGNPVLGVDAQARVWRNVAVLVGMYSRTGNGEFFIDRDPSYGERGDFAVRYLSHTWFAKAGASVRVSGGSRVKDGRAMPSSDLFAAGAMVRQFEANHPALNLGFRGSFPVASGLEATIGIEDYFVFWNEDALGPVFLELLGPSRTGSTAAELFYDTSHMLVLRLGGTFHF